MSTRGSAPTATSDPAAALSSRHTSWPVRPGEDRTRVSGRAQTGDQVDADTERDFVAFVEARSYVLFRTALALTGQRHQAEDLLQTVLVKALRHWKHIQGPPEAYLRRAMYRQQVSWWRRPGHSRELSTDRVPDRNEPDLTHRVDLSMALQDALRRLAPKHRAVLVLRYLEDLPDDEIAQLLGCKPSTVRSQTVRALSRLRTLCPDLNSFVIQETRR